MVQFSVYLPLQNSNQLDQLITSLQTQGSPNYQQWLTTQQFFFHTNIPGNNGTEATTIFGYDPVLGVGTPFMRNVILTPFLPAAGNPGTASNP